MNESNADLLKKAAEALQRNAHAREAERTSATPEEVRAARVAHDPGRPLIRIPCATTELAGQFEAWLHRQEIDVVGIEDREVLIPGTHPAFGYDLAVAAVENEFAHDDEAAAAAREFERTITGQ